MHNLSARAVHELFMTRKLKAVEIVEYFLQRIHRYEDNLGAFLSVYHDRALSTAKQLDHKQASGQPLGKLAGVPIALKDNIHLRGEFTTCGSKFLTDYRAPFSSTVAELIESEDGIILGKTNLDEFAMGSSTEHSAFHNTCNPWNLQCTPGGSSGGSAAAVAARCVPLALGSDTGGSIRQPAAFCGITGFKPTYGTVSRYGLVAFGSSFDQIGPFATSVSDTAFIMDVLAHHCTRDSTSKIAPREAYNVPLDKPVAGMKLGVSYALLEHLSPSLWDLCKHALSAYRSLGVEIVEVDFPLFDYSIPTYYILAIAEASTNLARFDGVLFSKRSENAHSIEEVYELSKEEGFGKEVKQRIMLGTYVLSSGLQDAYYRKAQKVRSLFIQDFNAVFGNCDAIFLPTSPTTAFMLGEIKDPLQMYLQDIYTIFANMGGFPAVSIPIGFDQQQKPFGIQISGPQNTDGRVLQMAYQLEQQLQVHHICPPLFRDEEVSQ